VERAVFFHADFARAFDQFLLVFIDFDEEVGLTLYVTVFRRIDVLHARVSNDLEVEVR